MNDGCGCDKTEALSNLSEALSLRFKPPLATTLPLRKCSVIILIFTDLAPNSMSVTDLLPILQNLSRADKLQVIEILQLELTKEETLTLLKNGQSYEIWSHYDAFEAENILGKMLEEDRENQDA